MMGHLSQYQRSGWMDLSELQDIDSSNNKGTSYCISPYFRNEKFFVKFLICDKENFHKNTCKFHNPQLYI